jgi:hypothetical protein
MRQAAGTRARRRGDASATGFTRAESPASSAGRAISAVAPATRLRQTGLDRESERLGGAHANRAPGRGGLLRRLDGGPVRASGCSCSIALGTLRSATRRSSG